MASKHVYTRRNFVRLGAVATTTALIGLAGCSAPSETGQGASSAAQEATGASASRAASASQDASSTAAQSTLESSATATQEQGGAAEPSAEASAEATFAIPDKLLASGYAMPAFGIGTWTLSNDEAEASCYCALENNYRLIDTAQYYGNEEGVGRALRRGIADGLCAREDVFVTSKVMPSSAGRTAESIDESLARLDIGYIDLMLIHQPGSDDEAMWRAMEEAVQAGKIRSIGISNYYTPEKYDTVASIADIPVALVQNENHPYYQNSDLQSYVESTGGFVESWYPLGGRPGVAQMLANETLGAIAAAHGKTVAQTILRWHVQAGYIAIPGSGNPDHIAENIQIFDFSLSEDDMARSGALNGAGRFENW